LDAARLGARFFFGTHFLKGLGGIALLGTVRIAFIAFLNCVNASGPSIISRVAGFMAS
jgi:hypothetical protein